MGAALTAVRGSSLRVVGMISTTLVGIFMMPFLIHSLGDRIYGFWALAGTFLGYYGLLDLGIVSAVQFYVAKALGEEDPTAANRAISTAFYAFAALGLAVALATVFVAFLAPLFVHSASEAGLFRKVIWITGIGVAVGFPGRAFIGAISASLRWDLISSVGLGVLVLRTVLIVLAIKAGAGIVGLAAITVLADIVTYVCYYLVLRDIHDYFRLSLALASIHSLKEVLRYSGFTLLVNVSDQLKFYVDVLVVAAILSVSAVTHYAIASRLTFTYRGLMIAIFGILSPIFSQLLGSKNAPQMKRVFELTTKLSTATAALIVCGMILYGRRMIELWMGKDYLDAYWPLLFLATGTFFEIAQIPSVAYMYGVSRHHFLAYVNLFEGTANLVLSLYLGRLYGMKGVALGTLIPMLVVWLFVQPVYVCRKMDISAATFYLRLFGRPAVVTCAAMFLPWLLLFQRMGQATLASFAACATCQAIIGFGAVYLFVLGREERDWVAQTLIPVRVRSAVTGTAEPKVESLT